MQPKAKLSNRKAKKRRVLSHKRNQTMKMRMMKIVVMKKKMIKMKKVLKILMIKRRLKTWIK